MSGNSSTHGGQVVCMKLTQTGLPLRLARSICPPPSWGTLRAGAGWPTWKFEVPLDAATLALGAGLLVGVDAAVAVALGTGEEVAATVPVGSGSRSTAAISSTSAVAMPATSPAMTVPRDPIR